MAAKQTDLTPELAQKILNARHPKQRRISRTTLFKYERAIRQGKWRMDQPDPILIDKNTGLMFNGAHRCQAVVNTGITIKAYIDWESDAELFDYIDTGLPRSAGQFLNVPHAYIRSSAARIMLWHDTQFEKPLGGVHAYWQMSEITDRANGCEELFTRLIPLTNTIYSRTSISQSVVLAAFALACERGWEDKVSEFAEEVGNPVMLMPSDPAWILFDRMSRYHNRNKRRQMQEDWTIFVRCLNAKINDDPLPVGIRMTGLWPRIGENEHDFRRRCANAAAMQSKRRMQDEAKRKARQ